MEVRCSWRIPHRCRYHRLLRACYSHFWWASRRLVRLFWTSYILLYSATTQEVRRMLVERCASEMRRGDASRLFCDCPRLSRATCRAQVFSRRDSLSNILYTTLETSTVADNMAMNGVTNDVPNEEGVLPIEPHETFDTILVLDFG